MNTLTQHLVNSRIVTTFDSIACELTLDKEKNYLFDLSYLGLLDVIGDKAIDFLQGQLTCDLQLFSDIKIVQGAQCNIKGRILSLVDIVQWNSIHMVLPKDLIETTKGSLGKTALLSRVTLHENQETAIFGFYLQNPQNLIPDNLFLPLEKAAKAQSSHYCYYHLGDGFYIFILQANAVEQFCKPFIEQHQLMGSLTWHTLQLYKKQINIYPESRGLFLPHRLDLHQTPYINFDKGCYKGQEIIARTHYRATLKHELKLFVINTEEKIYSGQKLFHINQQIEVGELVDYSPLTDNRYLIAVSLLKGAESQVRFENHSQLVMLTKI